MEDDLILTFPGGKRVDAEYKGFVIKTDQPAYQGGEGTAPAPFDLFLASLATCAGLYVMAFLQSRGMSVEESSIVMKKEYDPVAKRISKIIFDITLPPDFPEKYKKAVIKSINRCAVKVHILNPPQFEINT